MLMGLMVVVMGLLGLLLLAWTCLLAGQSVIAFFSRTPRPACDLAQQSNHPSTVVLMPAHNESDVIQATVEALLPQFGNADKLLVIADNCDDDTAVLAEAAGAWVVRRSDSLRRGKGYALAYGLDQLAKSPPDVVVVLDADCVLSPGGLHLLARAAIDSGRPVQALYLMNAAPGSRLKARVAAFAWAFRNQVRAAGYDRLGLPCQLMGSGMAFAWPLISKVSFATGHIVEDMKLGLDFARLGLAPVYLPEAVVQSSFPISETGMQTQRKRWEHGHLAMLLSDVPSNLLLSLRRGNLQLFALVLDMSVPPLALLSLLVVGFAGVAGFLGFLGSEWRIIQSLAAAVMLLCAFTILLAWWQVGRRWVTGLELALVPIYIVSKLPVYLAFLWRRQTAWVKTKR